MYKDREEKIVAIIEARMTSSRLPGKVLLPLGNTTVLGCLIERLKRSRYLDAICVATTTNVQDEPIVALARESGIACFRGSEADVLGRVLGAARANKADIIVEITGDCPFVDHRVVDRGIEEFCIRAVDFVSNALTVTYPHGGFEVQVFPTSVLAEVDILTSDPVDRTHVSHYMYQHPEKYRLHNFEAPSAARAPELRVVLDEEADYKLIANVFSELYTRDPDFSVEDVVQYLRAHPDIAALNKHVRGKKAHEL